MFGDSMIQINVIQTSALRIILWARYTLMFDEFDKFDPIFSIVNSSRSGLESYWIVMNFISTFCLKYLHNRNVFTCLIKICIHVHTIQHNTIHMQHVPVFFYLKQNTIVLPSYLYHTNCMRHRRNKSELNLYTNRIVNYYLKMSKSE